MDIMYGTNVNNKGKIEKNKKTTSKKKPCIFLLCINGKHIINVLKLIKEIFVLLKYLSQDEH